MTDTRLRKELFEKIHKNLTSNKSVQVKFNGYNKINLHKDKWELLSGEKRDFLKVEEDDVTIFYNMANLEYFEIQN